jgi:ATP-dependent Clp protease protease subunit
VSHVRYVLPQIEERTSYGYKRLDPYTKLFEERIIFLGQAIDDTVANDVLAQMLTLESMHPDQDIVLYLNSAGGSFTALAAIYDTMHYIRPDVQTVCLGVAASAAAVLLAAGAPGKRMAVRSSSIVIHQPAMAEASYGQASDLEIQARQVLRLRAWLEQTLAGHCKVDVERVRRDIERDKYLTAEEALDYGLIDTVLTTREAG